MKRSPTIELDGEFAYECAITKSWTDSSTGRRYIRGVASGVEEDKDGERCSASCIAKMARQIDKGGVKLTGLHTQDWLTEFGEVVKGEHDPETGELLIDCELPPEGADPIADKAWKTASSRPLGFSIGGKLRKAFYEVVPDTQKRRKVLDEVVLRHVMLTANPSYGQSFAEAVAKTFTEEVAEADFYEDVEKAPKDKRDQGAAPSMPGDDFAGERKPGAPPMDTEDPGAQEDPREEEDRPVDEPPPGRDPEESAEGEEEVSDADMGPDQRHLACPNCGHEFAASLPDDPAGESPEPEDDEEDFNEPDEDDEEGEGEAPEAEPQPDEESEEEPDDDRRAKRPVQKQESSHMAFDDTIAALQALVDSEDAESVEKADDDGGEPVEKESQDLDVLKMVAASHRAQEDRMARLEEQLAEAFGTVAKAVKAVQDDVASLPLGRKSIARIIPAPTGHENGEQTAEEAVAKAETPVEAIKVLNAQTYGITD